ncbi:MAG: ion transporter [Saprospiraceae bacterium]
MKNFFLSEKVMLTAIVLNSILIFLLYFPDLKENASLIFLDHFFIIFFIVEAIVKIKALGWKNYSSSKWNIFDFSIVIASLPSLLIGWVELPDTSVLLLLRLFRLIRLVRFIEFIPHLAQIMQGLGRALKASVLVLMMLFFLNFVLAILTCHFYGEIAPEFFRNPLVASFSIFQFFTVEGWNEIPATIAERSDNSVYIGFMRLYFVIVVLVGGIFGMSLANAIFVDEMTMDNNDDLEVKIDHLQRQLDEVLAELRNQRDEKA